MKLLSIIQYPDPRLRRIGQKVSNVKSKRIKKIIKDMINTLKNTENCAGLSSTQLNIDTTPNIIVIKSIEDTKNILCLINPEIIKKYGKCTSLEGCMSICPQNINAEIIRAEKIEVQAIDKNGKQIKFEADGFTACCIQHECDHLQGILYIDHLSKEDRLVIEKKILSILNPS